MEYRRGYRVAIFSGRVNLSAKNSRKTNMAANPQSLIDYFRTIVWIDSLIDMLGMGHTALDRLYFEKYVSCPVGADEAPGESDRRFSRYMEGKNVPRPDPVITLASDCSSFQVRLDPLRAMEQEAPGSARWFFHPLFNLLDGRIQSSKATLKRMRSIQDPGGKLFDDLLKMLRSELKKSLRSGGTVHNLPACLAGRRGDGYPYSIRMVQEEILRLDDDIVHVLFQERGEQLYRRPSEVSREVDFLSREVSVGHLTAAIGLYLEAELLVAVDRIQPIAELIKFQLPSLDREQNFKRVARKIATVVRRGFPPYELDGYRREEAEINGFPASWA